MSNTNIAKRFSVKRRVAYCSYSSYGGDGRIDTEQDLREFFAFVDSQIEKVSVDRNYANEMLHATGMYDKNGKLRDEFR